MADPEINMTPEHEGEMYLKLLGLDHLADESVETKDHGTIAARDFLIVCGDQARPYLVGFSRLRPEDPRYPIAREALRTSILHYIGVEPPAGE